MKSFCSRGHVWYAEFSSSLCPFCHEEALGAVRLKDLEKTISGLVHGLERSVTIHGDWRNYRLPRMLWAIGAEALEVLWAVVRLDIHGRHGVVNELRDLAICCIKGVMVLSGRGQRVEK